VGRRADRVREDIQAPRLLRICRRLRPRSHFATLFDLLFSKWGFLIASQRIPMKHDKSFYYHPLSVCFGCTLRTTHLNIFSSHVLSLSLSDGHYVSTPLVPI
jgi:hypothetical protein